MQSRRSALRRVYPRVGGGNGLHAARRLCGGGLSPRGRGKPCLRCGRVDIRRSIPAWAGETPTYLSVHSSRAVYPRVGGGNANFKRLFRCGGGLSPRGRGKRSWNNAAWHTPRSIPAWAGETNGRVNPNFKKKVYPRVGGGNALASSRASLGYGLSPRGRGKRRRRTHIQRCIRSIPAWAGETGRDKASPD